ncbi:MAG: extracellular solute-binding protein [Clostridia bacterium]|nr:extracellular solute-binding protein [Clostridia bacterium]
MKIRILSLILALALLLSALAGCESETTSTPSAQTGKTGKSGQTADPSDNRDPSADSPDAGAEDGEIVLDYSDFVMPEATNTLTIYSAGMPGLILKPAADRFRELYPEVNLDFQALGEDEYETRIQAEIPAGKGPDVLFGSSGSAEVSDVYKIIEAGILEDLNPYMLNDPDFHKEDYYDVLDVGLLNGVRGILPVEIKLPILLTTEEALADAGISREELRTWDGFMAAAHRYKEEHPDNTVFTYGRDSGYIRRMINDCGMDFIDYQNRVPAVDKEKMRQLVEFCSLDFLEDAQDYWGDGWYQQGGAAVLREALFSNFGSNNPMVLSMNRYKFEEDDGEHLIFETVPDVYDGVTAELVYYAGIPKSSPNKLNAWRFIRVLLSDEIQGGHDNSVSKLNYLRLGFPVRRESMEKRIAFQVRDFYSGGAPEFPEYEDNIARDIADLSEVYGRMTACKAVQRTVQKYIGTNIKAVFTGKLSFDKYFDKLYSTLELYASE